MDTKTDRKKGVNRAKIAVIDGVARGWTAKRTAFEHNINEKSIRSAAHQLKVAFLWERAGMPPKYSNQPVPVSTMFVRHRHTCKIASARICKIVAKMGREDPLAVELLRVVDFLRKRSIPEAWERRIQLTK